ncbi:MAG: hypothetical protein H6924_04670 [Alphaproteobacteria bacterium]|nr:hypothetical protein [Alphaproteobacteria bacterium]
MHSKIYCLALASTVTLCPLAPALAASGIVNAIAAGRPVIDLRGRFESAADASKTVDANALTLRARLGYETDSWNGLSLQADFDQVWSNDAYNSTRNGKTDYPVVADPSITGLNRLQLTYASDFGTRFVLGRQRLLIGNQRFVGNSGWRQHEQTFDAVSAVNTSVSSLKLTYAWLYRINRIFGPDLPSPSTSTAAAAGQASYLKSDSHILDGVYTGVPRLRVEGYAFLLDLRAPGYATLPAQVTAASRLSTRTYGGRADYSFAPTDGVTGKVTGEFAHQDNYAGNPLSFGLNYWLGEGSATWKGVTGLAGYEILEGNGAIGFATPLATLHAFNGWADMFLTTPANGLKNFYLRASYNVPADFIGAKTLVINATWHDFKTDNLNTGIGTEWDTSAELTVDSNLSFLLKYADYNGAGAAVRGFVDKSVFWLQTAYKY